MRTLRTALLVLLLLAPTASVAAAGEGDLIVLYEDGVQPAERIDARRDAEVALLDRLRGDASPPIAFVEPRPGQTTAEALAELRADPRVAAVARDGVVEAAATDTYWADARFWSLQFVNADDAWVGRTFAPVVVGVVDTGVQMTHQDLANRIAVHPGEIPGNDIDDDGNGYADDTHGWDWIDDDDDPSDASANGHGTHVAGTIAAEYFNGVGIAGIAPNATVMPLRVLGEPGTGDWAKVLAAFDYAGDLGLPIVNGSLGGTVSSTSALHAQFAAIARAYPGTLYVLAAGNGGTDGIGDDNDVVRYLPCGTDAPNVVCVAASTSQDALTTFSNYGVRDVDLAAPGKAVFSTVFNRLQPTAVNYYQAKDGTSMAAPHVAGVAALIRGLHPTASAAAVRHQLMETGVVVAGMAGKTASGRRLDAAAALDRPVALAVPSTAVTTTTVGATVTAGAGAWAGSPSVIRQWRRDGADIAGANGLSRVVTADDAGTTLTFRETAANVSGASAMTSQGIVVAPLATVAPTVARTGTTLTTDGGTWLGAASATTTYRWFADGAAIAGEIGGSVPVTRADVGKAIAVEVVKSIGAASTTATSAAVVVDAAWFPPVAPTPEPELAGFSTLRGVAVRTLEARRSGRLSVLVMATRAGVRTTLELRLRGALVGRRTTTVGMVRSTVAIPLTARGRSLLRGRGPVTLDLVATGVDDLGRTATAKRAKVVLR